MKPIVDRLFYGTMRLEWSYVDRFPIPQYVNAYFSDDPSRPIPCLVKYRVSRGTNQFVITEDTQDGGDYVFELYEDSTAWSTPRQYWDAIYDAAEEAEKEREILGQTIGEGGQQILCLGEDGNYYFVTILAQHRHNGKMYYVLMAPGNTKQYASFEIIQDDLGVAYYKIEANADIQIAIMMEIYSEDEREKATSSSDFSIFEANADSDLF